MIVMVINSGSSSVKYQLFDMTRRFVLASGLVEKIGEKSSQHIHQYRDSNGEIKKSVQPCRIANHNEAFEDVESTLEKTGILRNEKLFGIGHRVVHGGEAFRNATVMDAKVIEKIREQIPLAPLHNPANLLGIEILSKRYPKVPQVAVFDTAFHQTIPPYAYRYALPQNYYSEFRVRRYGFHGTSHQFVSREVARILGKKPNEVNLIVLHLGNGASVTAVRNGKSVDTSMGMTPLEGLIMGTRSGDIDPAIPFYIARKTSQSFDEIESTLNKKSGLKGICGLNDMREIERLVSEGHTDARMALEMYCYRIKKYIGMYFAVLGSVDAIVFTAGIGENSSEVRFRSCEDLSHLGIILDPAKNSENSKEAREIQHSDSTVKVLVIPTNEELEIAEQTVACIKSSA